MALYHFSVKQIRRSAGQSAIAAAAYRVGERLYSEYYGEQSDYTHKGGVIHTEILLPENAPEEYRDRATLWNAVEKAEQHPKAQLAYSFDFALQNELTMEENITLAREFVQTEFVDRGMIADMAIHAPDTDGGIANPHVHVMATMRPLNPDGTFGPKQRREYALDENGNRIRKPDGQYVFNAVHSTDWHSQERLEAWRAAWARMINERFEAKGLNCRVDHRSYARQGVDLVPTIHEGPKVRQMEARGIVTEKGETNRAIRVNNRLLQSLRKKLKTLIEWIEQLQAELEKPKEKSVIELLSAYNAERQANVRTQTGKVRNLKEFNAALNYLYASNITTVEELDAHFNDTSKRYRALTDRLQAITRRTCELEQLIVDLERYQETKPVFDELNAIHWKGKRERFQQEHDQELRLFYTVRRRLKETLGGKKATPKAWQREIDELRQEYAELSKQFCPMQEEIVQLSQVRRCINIALKEEKLREEELLKTKRHNREEENR